MDHLGQSQITGSLGAAETAQCPSGVVVYDADGEKVGTVSNWQDIHQYLIVHKGQLFGQDTYIPHAAIQYSDMNGVHLRLRQRDLPRSKQPLSEEAMSHSLSISSALPILAPDMGLAAVAAMAFTGNVTPSRAQTSGYATQLVVEASQENIVQTSPLPKQGKSWRLWRHSNK